MNAITVLPGIHLVASGEAGFDVSDRLDCHVYLVAGATSWALIDSGSGNDSPRIIENIREIAQSAALDLTMPGTLLITHGHADHSGGAADMLAGFPSLRVFAGAEAAGWIAGDDEFGISLDRGKASGAYPDSYAYRGCSAVEAAADGDVFELGNRAITVVSAPGHAAGHLCFLVEDSGVEAAHAERLGARVLFSGDCVFTRGRISVQNLHDVDIPAYADTLARLDALGIDALLPGHYSLSLSRASRHITMAHAEFLSGRVPANAP